MNPKQQRVGAPGEGHLWPRSPRWGSRRLQRSVRASSLIHLHQETALLLIHLAKRGGGRRKIF